MRVLVIDIAVDKSLSLVSLCPLSQLTTHAIIGIRHNDVTALPPRHVTCDVIVHVNRLYVSGCKGDGQLLMIVDNDQHTLCSPVEHDLLAASLLIDSV